MRRAIQADDDPEDADESVEEAVDDSRGQAGHVVLAPGPCVLIHLGRCRALLVVSPGALPNPERDTQPIWRRSHG